MLYRALLLTLATARGWNDCEFPDVDYFAIDEGVGLSYTYANAAMNGNLYSGGYTKGNFAFVGVTDGPDVNPVPAATLWGDTTSDVQNLYVAEVNSNGSMTKGWHFKGSAIQKGKVGHGAQTNGIDATSGLKAMLDKTHVVVKGGFKQLLELPDGTVWSSVTRSDGTVRTNDNDQIPFLMKLDVSKTQGVGTGTTGWAKMMDDDAGAAGGVSVHSADGDMNGDMLVSYTAYSGYNATASYVDGYGRTKCCGAKTGGVHYVAKLAAADGAEVWKTVVPHGLSLCRAVDDGSFYCGYSMSASDGALEFSNTVKAPVVDITKAGLVKFSSAGEAQWVKATHNASFYNMGISGDGTLLAITGSPGSRKADFVSRIDLSAGNEGDVLWTDAGGDGTHGFRGCEVTDDGSEVIVFGQHTGTMTLTDTAGSSTTLRSRGSYEVFVAAYDATDGSGKWAMDGGGDGMEYFFAMSSDPVTHDVYVGGTSRSKSITWGDVKRNNPMVTDGDSSTPTGSSKAFTVKLKSSTNKPSCLDTCSTTFGKPQASDVKSGHCYIDRHCYAAGDFAPYPGDHCMKCDPAATSATAKIEWSGPDTTSMCHIDGKCVTDGTHATKAVGYSTVDDPCMKCTVSVSTSEYSPVAGCMLNMDTFTAACYDDKGSVTMSEAAKLQLMADKTSMTETVAAMATKNIVLTLTASGSVSDHSDTSSLQQGVATAAGVDKSLVTIEVTAGSVVVTATIAVPASTTADKMQASLSSTLGTAAAASTALGITVESPPTMAITTKKDADTAEMPTWAIAIIVIVAAMFFLVLVILAVVVSREQQGKPVFVPTSMKKSVGTPGV